LFLDEPELLGPDVDVAVRPVDVKGSTTAGPGDEFEPYWSALCKLAEFPIDQLPFVETTIDRKRVRASYNGGYSVVRRDTGILQRAADIFTRSVSAGLRPYKARSDFRVFASTGFVSTLASEYWGSNQAAFSVAAWSTTRRVRTLDRRYNVPLHSLAQPENWRPEWTDTAPAHVHYHWMFDPEHGAEALRLLRRLGVAADRLDWIAARIAGRGRTNSTEHSRSASASAPRRCIIVAGMHRSGTSAVARVVNLLGADIARELMPVRFDNDQGFWESLAVAKIHDLLLHLLGSAWHDPFPLPDRWIEADATQQAKRALAEEVRKDFVDSRLFVVKDPRITRLLPIWLEILDQLAIEPIVVIPVRNPLEVAASLESRDQLSTARSLLMYVRGYLEVELQSRGRRRLFVRYDQLLDDWRPFATRLADVAGSQMAVPSPDQAAEIGGFLRFALRHHRYSRADLAAARDVAAMVVEMFDRMRETADSGDETALRRSFDRLRETTAEATRLFQGLVAAERKNADAEIARLRDGRDSQVAEAMRLNDELTSASARGAALEAELASARDRGATLDAELAATRDRVIDLERTLATVEETSDARRKELECIKQSAARQSTNVIWIIGAGSFRLARLAGKAMWWTATLQLGSRVRAYRRLRRDRQLIAASGLFDGNWYLDRYPDCRAPWIDPVLHYLRHGAAEGRNPGPLFDGDRYLEQNPGVREAGVNPLVHYLRQGTMEGQNASALLDGGPWIDTRASAGQE
jgi:hypothetical protein